MDDQNAARGTSAMTDAARVVIIMANMTQAEAKDILPEVEQANSTTGKKEVKVYEVLKDAPAVADDEHLRADPESLDSGTMS